MTERDLLTTEAAVSFVTALRGAVRDLPAPRSLDAGSRGRARLSRLLEGVRRRLHEGRDAPVRVAFFGPTGAGKSKLFNSLAGASLSPSGFRRPYTRRSVYLTHRCHRDLLGETASDVEVHVVDLETFRNLVLVDTPDFDSVEASNRREAERVFDEAEAFVFVTDAQKYADHATWEYLERIHRIGKPLVLVLNKVTSDATVQDFSTRLDSRLGSGASASLVVIPELSLLDDTLLSSSDPGLGSLRVAVTGLVGSRDRRRETLLGGLEADLDALGERWGQAEAELDAYLLGLDALEARLGQRLQAAADEATPGLEAGLDPGLKAEIHARVLERIQRIDVFRYPRKIIALPFRGAKALLGRWIPWERSRRRAAATPDAAAEETFHALEAKLLQIWEGVRDDLRGEARCPGLSGEDGAEPLRVGHDELREIVARHEGAFRAWLQAEAVETASRLTGEHKLKFILSQVMYNSAVVGLQIHTAGGFTLAELMTDAVLSPLVAKGVGMALSSETVAAFGKRAREEHRKVVAAVLAEGTDRYRAHLAEHGCWRAAFADLRSRFELLERSREAILRGFVEGEGVRHAGVDGSST